MYFFNLALSIHIHIFKIVGILPLLMARMSNSSLLSALKILPPHSHVNWPAMGLKRMMQNSSWQNPFKWYRPLLSTETRERGTESHLCVPQRQRTSSVLGRKDISGLCTSAELVQLTPNLKRLLHNWLRKQEVSLTRQAALTHPHLSRTFHLLLHSSTLPKVGSYFPQLSSSSPCDTCLLRLPSSRSTGRLQAEDGASALLKDPQIMLHTFRPTDATHADCLTYMSQIFPPEPPTLLSQQSPVPHSWEASNLIQIRIFTWSLRTFHKHI